MSEFIELAYMRTKEVVAILERELEEAEMAAHYAADSQYTEPAVGGSIIHYVYMTERARTALARARAALNEIQTLAYERGAPVKIPGIV